MEATRRASLVTSPPRWTPYVLRASFPWSPRIRCPSLQRPAALWLPSFLIRLRDFVPPIIPSLQHHPFYSLYQSAILCFPYEKVERKNTKQNFLYPTFSHSHCPISLLSFTEKFHEGCSLSLPLPPLLRFSPWPLLPGACSTERRAAGSTRVPCLHLPLLSHRVYHSLLVDHSLLLTVNTLSRFRCPFAGCLLSSSFAKFASFFWPLSVRVA